MDGPETYTKQGNVTRRKEIDEDARYQSEVIAGEDDYSEESAP